MACRICGSSQTIEAHLIPRAFVVEVLDRRGGKHLITSSKGERTSVAPKGRYDKDLLCGPCDGVLGQHEKYAVESLREARSVAAPARSVIDAENVDGDRLVRFAAGIAWKYANCRPDFGRIDVGPYNKTLQEVAFGSASIPERVDLALVRMQDGSGDVFFYRAPKLDRQDGVNVVRFSVGGFLLLLRTDRRQPSFLPTETWLRGKQRASMLVLPAHGFEEWRSFLQTRRSPTVRRRLGL